MLSRRQFALHSTAAMVAMRPGAVFGDNLKRLDSLDPRGSVDLYSLNRKVFFDSATCKQVISTLWQAYNRTGEFRYGEWASIYGYPWWRSVKDRKQRIKFAQISQKMAEKLAADFPKKAAGHQWVAIHRGTQILSIGVVDALHDVPSVRKSLERAMAIDANYFYGLPTLILAKMYSKLPQFPVSIGDLDHAFALLQEIKDMEYDSFAVWHLFLAESFYFKGNTDKAIQVLDNINETVKPRDQATAYLKESTLHDAVILKKKILNNDYDRYLWDPLLEPAQASD